MHIRWLSINCASKFTSNLVAIIKTMGSSADLQVEQLCEFLSVVVPAYNEEEAIISTLEEISRTCKLICKENKSYEVLVVDDGSTDQTVDMVKKYLVNDPNVKIIQLAENSGHMAAITAGLDHAKGQWVATLDADGQDPPTYLIDMFEAIKKTNADICFAVRSNRKSDPIRHRIFSPLFYLLLNKATSGNTPVQAADFRLMSYRVVNAIKELTETNRVYRVLVADLKFKTTRIEYQRNARIEGVSKYSFIKLASLAFNSFLATKGQPIRLLSLISLFVATSTLCLAISIFFIKILGNSPSGWASLALLLASILFFQSLSMFLISEVLLRISSDTRKRPIYQLFESKADRV